MGLLGSLFGKSAKSSSSNQAYGDISGALKPTLGGTANVFNSIGNELAGGFDAFKDKSGFNFQLNKGTRDIAGGAAARGLLNSGSTSKALAKYETDLGSQSYGNFFNNLLQALQGGSSLASILAGAGQTSTSKGGSGGIVGGLTSIFSDERLKEDVVRVGTADNGLPIYAYRYIGDPVTRMGFMAHEVEVLHPEAVSTHETGYKMVDYGKAVL